MRKGGNPEIGRAGSGVFGVGRRTVGSWIAERRIIRFGKERAAVIVGEGLAIAAEMWGRLLMRSAKEV